MSRDKKLLSCILLIFIFFNLFFACHPYDGCENYDPVCNIFPETNPECTQRYETFEEVEEESEGW